MTAPKVSICIPSYNHARFLSATIESALAQTYENIEIVIVDDGSTDNSFAIAKSYAAKHPSRVFVYTHPGHRNRGTAASLNLAAEKSTGEYWSIMGSDDVLYAQKTERQVTYMETHPDVAWVYSTVQFIDEQGRLLPDFFGEDITADPRPTELLITGNRIPAMTVMARFGQFLKVGPHAENLLYEDWEIFVRMSALFKAGFIAEPLVQYRVHSGNVSLNVEIRERARRYLGVLDSLKKNAAQYGGEIATPRMQALIEFRRARFLFALDQVEDGARALKSVFQIYPPLSDDPETFAHWMEGSYDPEPFYNWLTENLLPLFKETMRTKAAKLLRGLVSARAAKTYHEARDLRMARRMAVRAIVANPQWSMDREIILALIEASFGPTGFKQLLRLKQRAAQILRSGSF